jgi:hypothetical protein
MRHDQQVNPTALCGLPLRNGLLSHLSLFTKIIFFKDLNSPA